jgi:hypothetical protein
MSVQLYRTVSVSLLLSRTYLLVSNGNQFLISSFLYLVYIVLVVDYEYTYN